MSLSSAHADWLRRCYAAIDANDMRTALSFFADDATMRFANFEARPYREAFAEVGQSLAPVIRGTRHSLESLFERPEGAIAFELAITYLRRSGPDVTLNGSAFCVVESEKFTEQRLYVDLAPVLA